jgi:SAM-dependent methyltransferase
MVDELLFRLGAVQRRFTRVLDLGCADGTLGAGVGDAHVVRADAGFAFASAAGGIQCDEDRLPFADGSFDLVLSAGALHGVNDLPGALSLARRVLRPDGLFLAAFVGGETLSRLRAAFLAAEAARGGVSPRVAPMVEVRAAGDLLSRAGFALPVADSERLRLRYSSLFGLCADLRAAGETNILAERSRRPLRRDMLGAAAAHFAEGAEADGKVSEIVDIIYLTAWSPGPGQPQPLKPGSAKASLADALREARLPLSPNKL